MSNIVKTVTVETEAGPVVINESDFDAETMQIFEAVEAPEVSGELAAQIAEIGDMKKDELIEVLEGYEADTDGKVAVLKERLIAIVSDI